jgi:hypothetical protein
MDDIQNRKLNAYGVVWKVLNEEEFKRVWQEVEPFAAYVNELDVLMGEISETAMVQIVDRSGTTNEKRQARVDLTEAMMKVIVGVRALGVFTDDPELESEIWFTRWSLEKARDSLLVERATLVYEKALPLKDELVRCRVSEGDILLVNTLKGKFRDLVPQPRWETIQRKGATTELKRLFKAVDDLLYDHIDLTVKIFDGVCEEYVRRYFYARMIVDIGVRHDDEKPGVLEGTVMIEGTEIPLKNVRVQIEGRKRVVKTNEEGWFKFWFKKRGLYRPVFELEEYEKKTGEEMEIGPGKRESVMVFLRGNG